MKLTWIYTIQIFVVLAIVAAAGWFIWLKVKKKSGTIDPKEYRGDYGNLFAPPSAEAANILKSMTEEEALNFKDLLGRLQTWHESMAEKGPLSFHPEARASLWGAALGKIADHYRDNGRNDRALFFTNAAWNLCKHPVFAFNAGMLAIQAGDVVNGRDLLQSYLTEYQKGLRSDTLRLVNPEITAEELERLAKAARSKLAILGSG